MANSNVKATASDHLPGATEPPLPLTPERLELIKAYAKGPERNEDRLTASRIAQRFAPRTPAAPPSGDGTSPAPTPLTAPLSALASSVRTLTAVLVLVALLPNLTLAVFWLRAADLPWSKRVAVAANERPVTAVQSAISPPVLSAPYTLEASAGESVGFPIALDGTDGTPAHSIIVVAGLPQGSVLSNGSAQGDTEWNLKPDEIGDLQLVLPEAAVGESKLTIQLVAPPDDRIIADTSTILKVTADPKAVAGAIETAGEVQVAEQPAQELRAGAEGPASQDDAFASDLVPLPTRRPAPPASDDDPGDWIKASAFVNLRQDPKPSAPVISVVAKGAKLRVIGRKQRWVQVSDPATSESGWIYAGNVDTVR